MKRTVRSILAFALLVALLSMPTFAVAQEPETAAAPGASSSELVLMKRVSPRQQEAALAFWTREAIAAAQPLEMPSEPGPAEVDTAALDLEATGPPGFVAPGAAAPGADEAAQAAYPDDWAALEEMAVADMDLSEPTGTSEVYTSYFAQNRKLQKLYPYKWVGRLSFRTPTGTGYCSATSISGNVVLTAAHCLYDTTNNRWYRRWVFTPAYRDGSAPYGTFAARNCFVLTRWANLSGSYRINTWARWDVGVCQMRANSDGKTLNQAVGWMGRQWNEPYVQHLHDLGYPFRDYNDRLIPDAGKYLHICAAESFQQARDTRGMGCDMSRGKSGGPFMTGYAPGVVRGWADGVYSGFFIGTANAYGARFNSNNIVPLCDAAGC